MGGGRETSKVGATSGAFSVLVSELESTGTSDFLFCFLNKRRDLTLDLSDASVDWSMMMTRTSGGVG